MSIPANTNFTKKVYTIEFESEYNYPLLELVKILETTMTIEEARFTKITVRIKDDSNDN